MIRIDDWPWINEKYNTQDAHDAMSNICGAFNANKIPFILGVIPAYLSHADGEWLARKLGQHGKAVQHGWCHCLSKWPHENFEKVKAKGGELQGAFTDMVALVRRGDAMLDDMLGAGSVDRSQYIAPFNTYSQEFVDALHVARPECRSIKLHTCDQEYNAYGYGKFNYHDGAVVPVVGKLCRDYDFVNKILARVRQGEITSETITLHWVYDLKLPNYKDLYNALAKELACRRQ